MVPIPQIAQVGIATSPGPVPGPGPHTIPGLGPGLHTVPGPGPDSVPPRGLDPVPLQETAVLVPLVSAGVTGIQFT